ncbi:PLP-dependent cysteine synthase family protein [Tautonia rosea]|uniref:PLP-dependent cysteine synthase family protein n=1 Tax=Tautonia rosea TaxID=2728037 RepID=UPI0014746BFE|nr:cysteine synthase family protein [Tautonia rosea]
MSRTPPPLASSILETIGQTPLVELGRLVRLLNLSGRLFMKLEYFSPGGSKKDRVAAQIIGQARRDGTLREGQTVVELTSGNTGTGLAIVCRMLDHPFVAVMSRGNSIERVRMMAALGAEVALVDQAPGSIPGQVSGADLALVEATTQRVVSERGAFRVQQFEHPGNVLAHEQQTGPELWEQSGGTIDVYVDCPGTSGSLTGVARVLKRKNPSVRIYAVEPRNSAVLAGKSTGSQGHRIQGAGYSRSDSDLPLFERSHVDGFLQVTDQDVIASARLLAREEGIFAGFSTAAHLAAAFQLLQGAERGSTIAMLACDSGMKYLSTDLYES